jgi:hypothetical protein
VTSLEYQYGGQWFDDMGSLAAVFSDAPALGIEIGRAHLKREEANGLASNLLNAGVTPYASPEPPIGV